MRAATVLASIGKTVGILTLGIMTLGIMGSAHAQSAYIKGNDTGGIIAWSCESELAARDLAAAHCAWYGKRHRITGVHRQYGDYISFHCLWDARKAHFSIPPVRTRTRACPPSSPYLSARY